MSRILVLTKNILAELELQALLQQLNYEVLVSSSLYGQLCYQMPLKRELSSFQIVLFSETLTDNEVDQALPILLAEEKILVQRVDEHCDPVHPNICQLSVALSPRQQKDLIEELLKSSFDLSVEAFQALSEEEFVMERDRGPISILSKFSFTRTELKILEVLYDAEGKLVTKEDMAQAIWQQELTKSRVVQIYTSIGKIKDKLMKAYPTVDFVGTQRSIGYFLTNDFYKYFTLEMPHYTGNHGLVSS